MEVVTVDAHNHKEDVVELVKSSFLNTERKEDSTQIVIPL
jgi:hypothetical protein